MTDKFGDRGRRPMGRDGYKVTGVQMATVSLLGGPRAGPPAVLKGE
ncbi:hypothetical protein ACM0CO_19120 [Mycobacteroides abscessus subsp. abscessus]